MRMYLPSWAKIVALLAFMVLWYLDPLGIEFPQLYMLAVASVIAWLYYR
jgi:hypothetical protein